MSHKEVSLFDQVFLNIEDRFFKNSFFNHVEEKPYPHFAVFCHFLKITFHFLVHNFWSTEPNLEYELSGVYILRFSSTIFVIL